MPARTWPPLPGILKKEALLDQVEPTLASCVLSAVRAIGGVWTVAQAARTDEEQKALYAIGRTKKGKCVCRKHPMGLTVTEASDASRSAHGLRIVKGMPVACAVDVLALTLDGQTVYEARDRYDALGAFVEACGMGWGGRFHRFDPLLQRRVPFYDGGHVELVDYEKFPSVRSMPMA